MEPNQTTSLFQLNLDANSSYSLRGAAVWAKVMAVIGLIFGLLFVALAFLITSNKSEFASGMYEGNERLRGYGQNTAADLGMAVYIVMGLIFIISSVFALAFANKIGRALRSNDQQALGSAFGSVRNYFAFWAIVMILLLLLTIIGIAGLVSGMS